jgi:WD40 repeat protein
MQKLGKYAPESWQSDYSQKQYHFNSNRHYTGTIINPSKPEIAAATVTDMVLWDLTNPCRPVPTILPFDMAQKSKPAFDSFAYNPTGSQIAISRHGTVKICDIKTKTIISTEVPVQHASGFTYSLLFSHDGNKLIAYRNDGDTGRFNIYDLATKTWSYKTFDRMTIEKLARYGNDSYVSHSPATDTRKIWNSDFELTTNTRAMADLFLVCDTEVYCEKEHLRIPSIMSDEAKKRINLEDIDQLINSRRPFVSADRTKLAKVVNKHDVPSHIVYTDTTPDIKQLTIDQLLAIKHQQKIVTND